MAWDLPQTIREADREHGPTEQTLLVVGPDGVTTIPVPERGTLRIGRAPESEVRVDDALLSRAHAVLHVSERIEIEDLGSANGTRVGDQRLASGERREVRIGQAIELGNTSLIVQRRSRASRVTRLRSHGEFEGRLEEECARGGGQVWSPFAVLRIKVLGPVSRAELESVVTARLRSGDVLAVYAPRELELLLLERNRKQAEQFARELEEGLAREGRTVQVGLAVCPQDATSPNALLELTSERLHGTPSSSVPLEVVVVAPAMRDLYRVIERVAPGSISVLLLGETGVGKEVVAEALHKSSPRRDRPFVRLNCAALSEQLIESELFGHEKGAFTGAEQAKAGLLEAADRGTLFLDELGELPPNAQAKLLRAIEQREVLRVGSLKPRPVDVRVVSATNRDLEAETGAGRFRRDLYFRLNAVTLSVPPLRDRKEEIEPLAHLFIERVCAQMGFSPRVLSPAALDLLRGYAWPGNIRELRNVIERAVLLSSGEVLEPIHLPFEKLSTSWQFVADRELPPAEEELRSRVLRALEQCGGNQSRAAEALGVSRQTLLRQLDRFGIRRPRKT